jgi:hypothetical protein
MPLSLHFQEHPSHIASLLRIRCPTELLGRGLKMVCKGVYPWKSIEWTFAPDCHNISVILLSKLAAQYRGFFPGRFSLRYATLTRKDSDSCPCCSVAAQRSSVPPFCPLEMGIAPCCKRIERSKRSQTPSLCRVSSHEIWNLQKCRCPCPREVSALLLQEA